jgi:hypothetical protein
VLTDYDCVVLFQSYGSWRFVRGGIMWPCHRSFNISVECYVLKNAVFRDVTPCGYCKNRRFGGTYRLHHQGGKNK